MLIRIGEIRSENTATKPDVIESVTLRNEAGLNLSRILTSRHLSTGLTNELLESGHHALIAFCPSLTGQYLFAPVIFFFF
jgi:hypothetical protein